MSVCAQTEEETGSEEAGGGGGGGVLGAGNGNGTCDAAVRDMYEQKAVSTVVRVLTVLAYLLSVSLAAILLSVYYVCVWQSPKLPPLNDTGEDGRPSAQRADPPPPPPPPHAHYYNNFTGLPLHTNQTRGGNSTVSEAPMPPAELTSLPTDTDPPDPSISPSQHPNTTEADLDLDLDSWATPNVTQQLNITDQR